MSGVIVIMRNPNKTEFSNKLIAIIYTLDQVLTVSNNTIGKDITNLQLGKKRGVE